MRVPQLGDPEVGDLRGSLGGEEHVRGFDVAVNDAFPVREVEGTGQEDGEPRGLLPGEPAIALHAVGERAPGDELHGDERHRRTFVGRGVVGDDDVRVQELRRDPRLLEEARQERFPLRRPEGR